MEEYAAAVEPPPFDRRAQLLCALHCLCQRGLAADLAEGIVRRVAAAPAEFQLADVAFDDARDGVVASCYGHTRSGQTVCAHVRGFRPWFYLQVHRGRGNSAVAALRRIFGQVGAYLCDALELVRRPQLRGFRCNADGSLQPQLFVRVVARTMRGFYTLRKFCAEPDGKLHSNSSREALRAVGVSFVTAKGQTAYPHESRVSIASMFIAAHNVRFGQWLQIDALPLARDELATRCDVEYEAATLRPVIGPRSDAPVAVMAFDIEVVTHHRVRLPSLPAGQTLSALLRPGIGLDAARHALQQRALAGGLRQPLRVACSAETLRYGERVTVRWDLALPLAEDEDGDLSVTIAGHGTVAAGRADRLVEKVRLKLRSETVSVKAVVEPTELRLTLECVTELRDRFPNADDDPVCCIGVTTQRHGLDAPPVRLLLSSAPCDPVPGVHVQTYGTEAQMLLGFAEAVRRTAPLLLLGYNSSVFDTAFLHRRACKLMEPAELASYHDMSQCPTRVCRPENLRLSSCAMGDNAMVVLRNVPNLVEADAYFFVSRPRLPRRARSDPHAARRSRRSQTFASRTTPCARSAKRCWARKASWTCRTRASTRLGARRRR
jgi:hypothetical protein